jgi:hypothetical protein
MLSCTLSGCATPTPAKQQFPIPPPTSQEHSSLPLAAPCPCPARLLPCLSCCRERRGGRDHIWLVTHDEASCYVPAAIRSSIILSHWGRMDDNHTSNTG